MRRRLPVIGPTPRTARGPGGHPAPVINQVTPGGAGRAGRPFVTRRSAGWGVGGSARRGRKGGAAEIITCRRVSEKEAEDGAIRRSGNNNMRPALA